MPAVKYNTVLIVIYIWRILHSPRAVIDGERNDSVILSCRMVGASCISLILRAKKAFRIAAGFNQLGCCNGFWILLRLRKVDGDIHGSIRRIYGPLLILLYTIAADVVTVLA